MADSVTLAAVTRAVATFAQALVRAGAIKPAAGFVADLLSLLAVRVASDLPQWEALFFVPFVMAVVLGAVGTGAIVIFFVKRPTPNPTH